MSQKRNRELLDKYQSNRLTRSEYDELLELLNKDKELQSLANELNHYWPDPMHFEKQNSGLSRKLALGRVEKWSLAAGVLIVVGFLSVIFMFKNTDPDTLSYQTGFGETLDIALPDGSSVSLNANSKIEWDNLWKGKGVRNIQLEGEAFFDVQHLDEDQSFFVQTKDLSIQVLGTSFNVDSRVLSTEVYLEEGKVQLQLAAEKDTIYSMAPGEKIIYKAEEKAVKKTLNETMTSAASWKNGVLNFKAMTFREVLIKLEEIYGKTLVCEDTKLLDTPMYLGVPYADWDAVKQALEMSLNVQFVESEGKYSVKSE
ncbi:FecR family protein [Membranihabitans marinus]|uniref:FecR family protein n=1 Tax=Membranihabitans marinus TaxID=1227546 RepID=UPI001F45D151|nr:FecR domain-containing protein [Membranihabitans marinus]